LFSLPAQVLPRNIRYLVEKGKTSHLGPVERCQIILPVAASLDFSAYNLRPNAVPKTGAHILRLLLSAVCGQSTSAPIDVALQEAWVPRRKAATRHLRAALILCADHELNVSAFTARCIASARATPYEVVAGALAALKGQRHGGMTSQVEVVFQEAARTRNLRQFLAKRLRMHGQLPGFGHPLYPNGDPRAALLLSLAQADGKGSLTDLAAGMIEVAGELTGEHPTLDFGLVALARALNLPRESPVALFALGRTVGWIAHAIEQYADDLLIRPRARYVGVIPGSSV
jgi:citrate synthase